MSSLAKKTNLWANISSYSPYLSRIRNELAPVDESARPELNINTEQDIYAALRHLKKQVALHTAYQDISGLWDVPELTRYLADFADFATRAAFDFCLEHMKKDGLIPKETGAENSGVAIIALGKWGAAELNYSSDIDFMVIFDPDRMPIDDPYMAQKYAVRFTQSLVDILNKQTRDGYVFRCDLRLRPDPGATQVAVSIKACEVYYGTLGQNWERAAMIKARPVIGDERLSQDFKDLMQQWIWRRHLDFTTIQDIVSLKNQMEAQDHRDFPSDIRPQDIYGYDVKRGVGGIREIELFVQIQQLIYGGRRPDLQVIQTCEGLQALAQEGLVTSNQAQDLIKAYEFLRDVEHRLQMYDDRQTHSLPDHPARFDLNAAFCGFENAADFIQALQKHRREVSDAFTSLYADTDNLTVDGQRLVFTGAGEDKKTVQSLEALGFKNPSYVAERIRDWHHGSYRALKTERSRQILTRLVPVILTKALHSAAPDEAFKRFDRFLEHQQSGVYVLSLMEYNQDVFDTLFQIFAAAPRMAEYLIENPEQLEVLLVEARGNDSLPDYKTLLADMREQVKHSDDFEKRLYSIAAWSKRHRFLASLAIINQALPIDQTFAYMSDIAEITLLHLLAEIQGEFKKQHGVIKGGQCTIVGFGRFGSRQMTIGSDLDIVMVYDAPKDSKSSDGESPLTVGQYYARLMQRLNTVLTTQTKHGYIYRTDLRLRPHGDAGALAVRKQDFKEYYQSQAWSLELLSLIRARALPYDENLATQINADIHEILCQPCDKTALKENIEALRAKTFKAFSSDDIWDVKYHRGGLMDMMFDIQGVCLTHAHDYPDVLQRDTRGCIKALEDAQLIPAGKAKILIDKTTLFKRLQTVFRMTGRGLDSTSDALILSCFKDIGDGVIIQTIPAAKAYLQDLYGFRI